MTFLAGIGASLLLVVGSIFSTTRQVIQTILPWAGVLRMIMVARMARFRFMFTSACTRSCLRPRTLHRDDWRKPKHSNNDFVEAS